LSGASLEYKPEDLFHVKFLCSATYIFLFFKTVGLKIQRTCSKLSGRNLSGC
jgi:hypothetical protein